MQDVGVEIKKRKLSLKNTKTSKCVCVENENTSFTFSIPPPQRDVIEIDAVDVVDGTRVTLSDKQCQEDITVTTVRDTGLQQICALIERFKDEIPQHLNPLPDYQGPPQAGQGQARQTSPTQMSPLPHLCLTSQRMRTLISSARQDMMKTALQCVKRTCDKVTSPAGDKDVELPSMDTHKTVNKTAELFKHKITTNQKTTHSLTGTVSTTQALTSHRRDLHSVTKPTIGQTGQFHSHKTTGINYSEVCKSSTSASNNSQTSRGDTQLAPIKTKSANQTLTRCEELSGRHQQQVYSSNFGGASCRCEIDTRCTQADLLTSCPLCSEEFPRGMSQIDTDHHIAQCIAAADEEMTW